MKSSLFFQKKPNQTNKQQKSAYIAQSMNLMATPVGSFCTRFHSSMKIQYGGLNFENKDLESKKKKKKRSCGELQKNVKRWVEPLPW